MRLESASIIFQKTRLDLHFGVLFLIENFFYVFCDTEKETNLKLEEDQIFTRADM